MVCRPPARDAVLRKPPFSIRLSLRPFIESVLTQLPNTAIEPDYGALAILPDEAVRRLYALVAHDNPSLARGHRAQLVLHFPVKAPES